MKIDLPKSIKSQSKEERRKILTQMRAENITQEEWKRLNEKYQTYTEMVKPFWTSDAIVVVVGNLLVAVVVCHAESLRLIPTRALNFMIKGRV